ncbi:putative methyltransferase-domain-containing protein [Cyathus striatus]|nr:putative methyltransferase-domain-containing protein [Cyathus striatus]
MVSLRKDLFILLRGFLGHLSPNNLSFPPGLPFKTIHDFLLNNILLNPHVQAYSPSSQYQKLFWKWAISQLEGLPQSDEDAMEIDSRIYEHYLRLLQPSGFLSMQHFPPAHSYITHYWKPYISAGVEIPDSIEVNLEDYHTVTLLESCATVESGTTGLRTWMASFVLAQYLILHPDLVSSKRILELGSGIGFLGIIIASLQRLSGGELPENPLWLTDVNEEVLARCKKNLSLPCSHPNYRNLDWLSALDENQISRVTSLLNEDIDADLVVGADIVFDPSLIPALVAIIKIALQSTRKSKTALIALTVRNENTFSNFLQQLSSASLNIVDIPLGFDQTQFTERVEGSASHKNVKLFQITI